MRGWFQINFCRDLANFRLRYMFYVAKINIFQIYPYIETILIVKIH